MAENESKISWAEYERLFVMKLGERILTALVGFGVFMFALCLYNNPPIRQTTETTCDVRSAEKVTQQPADPATVVIALLTAGFAVIVYGLNGIRIFKIDALGVTTAGYPPPGPNENSPPAGAPPAPIPVPPVHAAAPGAVSEDALMRQFLLRSSWNGLKLLKACQVASKRQRILPLRMLAKVGTEVSYDYVFGYFIASFSAGAFIGNANPASGQAVISEIHRIVDAQIDEIIEGNIRVDPSQTNAKRVDLAALMEFLRLL